MASVNSLPPMDPDTAPIENKNDAAGVKKYGYKIVDRDLCGLNKFKYAIGKSSHENGPLSLCRNGLHFCVRASDCYQYVSGYSRPLRFLRVCSIGDCESDGDKSATLALYVEAELTQDEWMVIIHAEATKSGDPHGLLRMAIELTDIKNVHHALATARDPSHADDALILAAEKGYIDAMEAAIKHGAKSFDPAYIVAARHDQSTAMELLLKRSEKRVTAFEDALNVAAQMGHVASVGLAIRHGAKSLDAALSLAADGNHIETMKLLIGRGSLRVGDFNWALIVAADSGNFDAMKLLAASGATNFEKEATRVADGGGYSFEDLEEISPAPGPDI